MHCDGCTTSDDVMTAAHVAAKVFDFTAQQCFGHASACGGHWRVPVPGFSSAFYCDVSSSGVCNNISSMGIMGHQLQS
jgi:hypothetical protein